MEEETYLERAEVLGQCYEGSSLHDKILYLIRALMRSGPFRRPAASVAIRIALGAAGMLDHAEVREVHVWAILELLEQQGYLEHIDRGILATTRKLRDRIESAGDIFSHEDDDGASCQPSAQPGLSRTALVQLFSPCAKRWQLEELLDGGKGRVVVQFVQAEKGSGLSFILSVEELQAAAVVAE